MGSVARPSSLTPELRERIERDIEDGIPIVVVAQDAGMVEDRRRRGVLRPPGG
jgi:hypothetical protein